MGRLKIRAMGWREDVENFTAQLRSQVPVLEQTPDYTNRETKDYIRRYFVIEVEEALRARGNGRQKKATTLKEGLPLFLQASTNGDNTQ